MMSFCKGLWGSHHMWDLLGQVLTLNPMHMASHKAQPTSLEEVNPWKGGFSTGLGHFSMSMIHQFAKSVSRASPLQRRCNQPAG